MLGRHRPPQRGRAYPVQAVVGHETGVVQPRTGQLLLLALLELARVDDVHRTAAAAAAVGRIVVGQRRRSEVAPAAAAALVRHPAVPVLMFAARPERRVPEFARPRPLDRVFAHVLVQRQQQEPEHDDEAQRADRRVYEEVDVRVPVTHHGRRLLHRLWLLRFQRHESLHLRQIHTGKRNNHCYCRHHTIL